MPAAFVEDAFFFTLHKFIFVVKIQVFLGVWIKIWVLDSIPLVNLSVFMPIPRCFHYCSSKIGLYIRDGDASRSSSPYTMFRCGKSSMKLLITTGKRKPQNRTHSRHILEPSDKLQQRGKFYCQP